MYVNEILKQLKSEISEYEFQSYFSILEYDENSQRMDLLEFYAPNIFIADWIETNYIEKLKLCTEKVAGIQSEIHIYVKEFPKDVKNFKNNKTIQEEVEKYKNIKTTYTEFKRKTFKCTSVKYDELARITEMKYEET